MSAYRMLVKRNLLIYFRDRSAVFFSILSSIITLCLYLFFINGSIIGSMSDEIGNIDNLKVFLNVMVVCGVISLNTFSIPLSFMSLYVHDREGGKLKDFFVSPVKKEIVVFSYIICAIIATLLINLIVLAFLIGYLFINEVLYVTLSQGLMLFVFYMVSSLLFSAIAFFIANFVKSTNAYGNIIGLSSAVVGFLSGVYMPIGNFGSEAIENVITLFPITQLNAVFKTTFLGEISDKVFNGAPSDVSAFYHYYFGINLKLFETDVTVGLSLVYIVILLVVFSVLVVRFVRKA